MMILPSQMRLMIDKHEREVGRLNAFGIPLSVILRLHKAAKKANCSEATFLCNFYGGMSSGRITHFEGMKLFAVHQEEQIPSIYPWLIAFAIWTLIAIFGLIN